MREIQVGWPDAWKGKEAGCISMRESWKKGAGQLGQNPKAVDDEPSYQGVKEKTGLFVGTQPQLSFPDNSHQASFVIFTN